MQKNTYLKKEKKQKSYPTTTLRYSVKGNTIEKENERKRSSIKAKNIENNRTKKTKRKTKKKKKKKVSSPPLPTVSEAKQVVSARSKKKKLI